MRVLLNKVRQFESRHGSTALASRWRVERGNSYAVKHVLTFFRAHLVSYIDEVIIEPTVMQTTVIQYMESPGVLYQV